MRKVPFLFCLDFRRSLFSLLLLLLLLLPFLPSWLSDHKSLSPLLPFSPAPVEKVPKDSPFPLSSHSTFNQGSAEIEQPREPKACGMTFFPRKRPSPTLPTINFYSAFDSAPFRPSSPSSFKSAAVNHLRLRRSKAQGLPPLERKRAARGTEPNQIRRIGPRSTSSLSSHKTQPDLGCGKKENGCVGHTHSLMEDTENLHTRGEHTCTNTLGYGGS